MKETGAPENQATADAGTLTPPEPWLRGTRTEVPAVVRGVLHALELTSEDVGRWCSGLSAAEMNARPAGLPSVAFQLRHMAGSLDRLLTYAEGRALVAAQLHALTQEYQPGTAADVLGEIEAGLRVAAVRLLRLADADLEQARYVGRRRAPTTLGGLLVHIADHTQRHTGQMVTTAQVVLASRVAVTSPASL